jgi:gamma-glutamylcyclotransferase (GGCT)/AIG2-like uncharacterized protein YtfP
MIPEPAGAGNCHLLFVYGTLRRGCALHHHLARLGARFRGEARVAAGLIDLGRYPGACPAGAKGKWVRGELFALRRPATDLRVLDKIEDFIPTAPQRSEFVRAVAEVTAASGPREQAWIYWLTPRAAAGRRRIAGGDYAAWRARRAAI